MDTMELLLPIIAVAVALLAPLGKRLLARQRAAALIDAINSGDAEAVKRHLATGANVDVANDLLDRTPLIVATMSGHAGIVRILLAQGANVHTKDMEGWTALKYAEGFGHEEIIMLLRSADAAE